MQQPVLFFLLLLLLVVFSVDSQQPSLECSCPVPVSFASAFISEGNKVTLIEDVLDAAMRPLVEASGLGDGASSLITRVLSVVGTMRKGKSTIMNMQVQSMVKPEVWAACEVEFGISHDDDSFTKGLWMWAFPADMMIDGEAVIFIDTQGLDDPGVDTDAIGRKKMMVFAMVISDALVFLTERTINDADFEVLKLGAAISEWMRDGTSGLEHMPALAVMFGTDSMLADEARKKQAGLDPALEEALKTRQYDALLENKIKTYETATNSNMISEQYRQRTLLLFPQADDRDTIEYRNSPLNNGHMLPKVDKTFLSHRKIVMSRVAGLLRDSSEARDPRILVEFWKIVADAVNNEDMSQLHNSLQSISVNRMKAVVDEVKTAIALRLLSLVKMTHQGCPMTTEDLSVVQFCSDCMAGVRALNEDPESTAEAVESISRALAESALQLAAENRIALDAIIAKREKMSLSRVAKLQQKHTVATAATVQSKEVIRTCTCCRDPLLNLQDKCGVPHSELTNSLSKVEAAILSAETDIDNAINSQKRYDDHVNGMEGTESAHLSAPLKFIARVNSDTTNYIIGPEITITSEDSFDANKNIVIAARKLTISTDTIKHSRGVHLVADEITVLEAGLKIDTSGSDGLSHKDSQALHGKKALNGGDGGPGGEVHVLAMKFTGGPLTVDSKGGAGGQGQQGFNGADGEKGDVECTGDKKGKRGEDGAAAGRSGNGGASGDVYLTLPSLSKYNIRS
jgi:hypothetical protein